MKKITILSKVENGSLKRNRNLILKSLEFFEGHEVEITIEKKSKKRSLPQNAFYWGVVLPLIQNGIKDCTGEIRDFNSLHYQIMLPLFSPVREIINKNTGEIIFEKITSSEMTTTQFMDFIMSIQKWAADFLGIEIPNPNEQISLL